MAATVPPFDEKLESWESYKERLENYFIAADVVDPNKKKALLLNSVGPSTYERVRNICYPSSVNDRLYEELLEVFSGLFTPPVITLKERKTFYGARKQKSENATSWHERLCRLAINCKFGISSEEILRDKFIIAFDGIVFEKFCNVGTNLTLREALDIAKVYETIGIAEKPSSSPKVPQTKNQQVKKCDTPKEYQQVKKTPKTFKENQHDKKPHTPKDEAKFKNKK